MRSIAALALAATVATPAVAAEKPWLHVSVVEAQGTKKVDVNLPMALIDVALASVKSQNLNGGHVRFGDKDIQLGDMRKAWAELKKAGDAQFVTVDDKDESVLVERKGDRMLVHITSKPSGKEKVRVDVPVRVVDALLSGPADSLDLKSAVAELGSGEFIRVDDGDSRVRVWID